MSTLAAFQQAFWRDLWSADAAPPTSPWAAQPGFAVYRNTVLQGCVDTLLAHYPSVRRLAGDAWFTAVALAYARAHPPQDARLACYGGGLPAFLASRLAEGELPWLPDVARLDALWSECHVAADAPVLPLATLAGLAEVPDILQREIRLLPHPATRWHAGSPWPAVSLWRRAREAWADPNPPAWRGECAVLTRPDGAVQVHEAGPGTCALLEACARRQTLTEAIASGCACEPGLDAGAALGLLLSIGAFTTVTS